MMQTHNQKERAYQKYAFDIVQKEDGTWTLWDDFFMHYANRSFPTKEELLDNLKDLNEGINPNVQGLWK